MDQGLPPEDARARAQVTFGSTTVAADECRDERGTAFIDNTIGDLQYALRTFKRAPLATLTIVVTVAIGLGVVAVLFTVLNVLLFKTDSVPDITKIYAVERPQQADGDLSRFTRQRFEALRSDTNVFTDAYAAVNDVDLRVDGRMMAVNLVSASFFRVVRVNPIMGRALSAADDDRAGGSPVVVLSDKGWQRQFNRDPNVIGRTVLVTGAPYEIVGVMPQGFRGLEVSAPDFWAPLARLSDFVPDVRGSEDKAGIEIIGRLKPGVSMESARAQLAAWDSNQSAATNRTMSIELLPRRGTVPQPLEAIAVFTPLFFAFGLILLIGCANVANLLLARGVARQRELGIRLSIGASRRRIVRQLLTESVLLALAAAAGGYLVSRLALEGAVYWAMRTIPVDLGDVTFSVPAADWRVALFLVLAAIAATAFFALLPALQATRIEPARTLRGELVKDARPGRARSVLIGVQVFASTLLLICSAIFLRSAIASSQFDPGFRTADTLSIDAINEKKRDAMRQALAAGLSQGVALSQSPPPQTESSLSRNPALVRDWANRLLANDRKVRATAEAALVKGAGRSLPLLRRFLASDDDDLHQQTFEIIRQIGPPAIPLLVELLRHEEVSFRGFAADALIDLAPDTESIQPALRRALRDEDSMVAADAARALGALGERASPSVARSRRGSVAQGATRPYLRGGGLGVHRSEGERGG